MFPSFLRSREYPDLGALEAELESVREKKKKRRLESGEAEDKSIKRTKGAEGGGPEMRRPKKEVSYMTI
jgi:hypothetical protein